MLKEYNDDKMKKIFCFRQAIDHIETIGNSNTTKLAPINAKTKYVKYTPISTLYKMLESDSLYLFCSELSNDLSENSFFHNKATDSFITCFYQCSTTDRSKNYSDVYSQWTSYCMEGGASIEFFFGQGILSLTNISVSADIKLSIENAINTVYQNRSGIFDYSILCNDYKKTNHFIKMRTFPFQVQYYNDDYYSTQSAETFFPRIDDTYIQQINTILTNLKLTPYEVSPYFKHSGFIQENEARLVFQNTANELNHCIQFLQKKDGALVPYIEIKFGDMDKNSRPCSFVEMSDSEPMETKIQEMLKNSNPFKFNRMYPIIIPQGHNQEKIYEIVEETIKKLGQERKIDKRALPKVICQGHLPITKITLAPTHDRKTQRKMLEIYCKSKYWLRNVEICESRIPYNTENVNHL